jgi:hypothetical protein
MQARHASRHQPLTTFSISSGTLKLHMLRTARPRMVGSKSLQSFSSACRQRTHTRTQE